MAESLTLNAKIFRVDKNTCTRFIQKIVVNQTTVQHYYDLKLCSTLNCKQTSPIEILFKISQLFRSHKAVSTEQ